ncbi:uncharacterized protein LOC119549729 [Drosophila subpulchrella]|uniref:uncharacterized protein LOC119549729 n=1 Tax=Drosophila subpulchrella TaxID=1486046 RepID=UPI0018A191A2|nr:uncharacterized protein LOC119549729 [Drosophila subpulchrella]
MIAHNLLSTKRDSNEQEAGKASRTEMQMQNPMRADTDIPPQIEMQVLESQLLYRHVSICDLFAGRLSHNSGHLSCATATAIGGSQIIAGSAEGTRNGGLMVMKSF